MKSSSINIFFRNLLGDNKIWLPIFCVFLAISFAKIHDGGTNANARFATLRAMSDDHTFKINNYKDYTMDWAKTPEGNYYSNKAPGPTLAAYPLFWLIDKALYPIQNKHLDEFGRRQAPRGIHKVIISGILQVLPFLFITLLMLQEMYKKLPQASKQSQFWALISILFANTAAALMSSYMGNPFTAVTILFFAYFYLRSQIAAATFFFAFTVLSEYSAGALLLPFIWLMGKEARKTGFGKTAKSLFIGGILPFALWCWYHFMCFGGILSLPYKYEMIAVVGSVEKSSSSLWGFISLLPNPTYLYELLFGASRGILFTQPWIFIVMIFAPLFYKSSIDNKIKDLLVFCFSGFLLLLSINAGFPGWHGGGNPGPRYLAAILPMFGFFIPLFYDSLTNVLKAIFVFTIIIGASLRGLAFATWILPPVVPIWPYYLGALNSAVPIFYFSLFVIALIAASYFTIKRMGKII